MENPSTESDRLCTQGKQKRKVLRWHFPDGGRFMGSNNEHNYTQEKIYELRTSVMNAITIIDEIEWRVPYDILLLVKDLKKEMYNLCTL